MAGSWDLKGGGTRLSLGVLGVLALSTGIFDVLPALAAALDRADDAVVDLVSEHRLKPVGTIRRRGFLCFLCLFVAIPRNQGLLRVSVPPWLVAFCLYSFESPDSRLYLSFSCAFLCFLWQN